MQQLGEKKEYYWLHTLIALVFLLDETLFPVFHPAGIPMKVSYVILLFALGFHLFSIRVGSSLRFKMPATSESKKIVYLLFFLILLSVLGEATMRLFSGVKNGSPFTDALLNYGFMTAAFILGYALYRYNKKALLWTLYLYAAINIALLMFYDSLPGFVTSLYGEYYATGIRIRGTGGNANTTLLVMNMILMSIVVLYKLRQIEITGVHVWLVLLVPILTNVFISSRGEFIHTVVLELFYIYLLLKYETNRTKTLGRVIGIAVLLIATYIYVFHYLYYINDSIRYGIDRLSTLGEASSVDEYGTGDADTVLRPFFRADVFWNRFKYSPLWGAGYSYGTAENFIKSANGYHNDWFRVLASTGIAGFCCWFVMVKKFVKRTSIMILLPFLLAGLSNTFLQSTHALNIYFFLFGAVFHLAEASDRKQEEIANNEV